MSLTEGRSQTNQTVRHATGVMGLMGFSICRWGRKAAEVEGDVYRNYDRINLGVN